MFPSAFVAATAMLRPSSRPWRFLLSGSSVEFQTGLHNPARVRRDEREGTADLRPAAAKMQHRDADSPNGAPVRERRPLAGTARERETCANGAGSVGVSTAPCRDPEWRDRSPLPLPGALRRLFRTGGVCRRTRSWELGARIARLRRAKQKIGSAGDAQSPWRGGGTPGLPRPSTVSGAGFGPYRFSQGSPFWTMNQNQTRPATPQTQGT